MKDLQELFNDLQSAKKEMKEIRAEFKDLLVQDSEYQELLEKLEDLKEKKKQHELAAQRDMGMRWERFEDLKVDVKSIKEMISDVSLTSLLKGESIEVKDAYNTPYEPVYNVTFKKAK